SGVKRLMGRRYKSSEISELRKTLPFALSENVNGDVWVTIDGAKYSPQEVSALILGKVKATAEDYFGEEITQAVLTVPAYFDDAQRQATKDAGKIAGLEIKRIINEPTAAALAYGVDRRPNATIAVFDLGGGTFDISVVQLRGDVFEVLSTSGDNSLGGDDFDRAVVRRLIEHFENECGVDISDDKMALQRVREAAEQAKCELSTLNETNINLPFLAVDESGPRHLSYVLSRHELTQLCQPFIDQIEIPCRAAIDDAGIRTEHLDDVILVGGMSRMPAIRELVEQIFGRKPNKSVNPDEVVAMGAALQGALMSGELKDVVLLDVTPLSLGIRVQGDRMSTIINNNAAIPARAQKTFTTVEANQDTVSIAVLQGESSVASENRLLGTFNLANIPPRGAEEPRIQVSFDIDHDGIVNVSAVDVDSGQAQSVVITDHGGLTDDEIRRASERARMTAPRDLSET
ncbi:MAG: molecular chaperone DnaK, partial [Bradymonadia bacterium]